MLPRIHRLNNKNGSLRRYVSSCRPAMPLKRPISLAEYRLRIAPFQSPVNVHIAGADQKINMSQAVIQTVCFQLLLAHLFAVGLGIRVPRAESFDPRLPLSYDYTIMRSTRKIW